jgi:hypothetical protein
MTTPFPVLPGRPLLITVVSGQNGEAKLVETVGARASALATPCRRPIKRQGHACLVNG